VGSSSGGPQPSRQTLRRLFGGRRRENEGASEGGGSRRFLPPIDVKTTDSVFGAFVERAPWRRFGRVQTSCGQKQNAGGKGAQNLAPAGPDAPTPSPGYLERGSFKFNVEVKESLV